MIDAEKLKLNTEAAEMSERLIRMARHSRERVTQGYVQGVNGLVTFIDDKINYANKDEREHW